MTTNLRRRTEPMIDFRYPCTRYARSFLRARCWFRRKNLAVILEQRHFAAPSAQDPTRCSVHAFRVGARAGT